MITKTKTKNSDLAELFGELPKSSDFNKQKLIEMAKNGKNRPKQSEKLGKALSHYISKSSQSYDSIFDKTIRKLRPDWFVSQTQISNQKKQKLIEMAKNGENKPGRDIKLGVALRNYQNSGYSTYDPVFDKTIKKLRPDWFVSLIQISSQKKQKLIDMAKNGENKPKQKTKIGSCLSRHTAKSSSSYDPIFDKTIRKLRPDWFVSPTQIVNQKKQKLIDMAKNGAKRPYHKTKEGNTLSSYTTKSSSSYDPIFDKTIRKLRPDWFVSPTQIVNQKKQKLIDMAKNGEDRPNLLHQRILGHALANYTLKSRNDKVYDPDFDKIIRELAPHWFKK